MSFSRSKDSMTGRSHQSCVLCPENDADPCDVLRALTPGRQAQDFAATRIGYEDSGDDFNRRRFAGAVRADVANELAWFDRKGNVVESCDRTVFAMHHALERTPDASLARCDLEGLEELIYDDLGHWAPVSLSQGGTLKLDLRPGRRQVGFTDGINREPARLRGEAESLVIYGGASVGGWGSVDGCDCVSLDSSLLLPATFPA